MIAPLLIELLIKSALVAGAGLTLAAALRFRPAVDRVMVLRATVCLLIALPVVAVFGPQLTVWTAAAPVPAPIVAAPLAAVPLDPAFSGRITPMEGVTVSGSFAWPSPSVLFLVLYALGALFVLCRFLAGVWMLRHWTSRGREVRDPAWTEPLARLKGQGRPPRLLAVAAASAPLSWGLPPGVILIGSDQLARPQDATAVLAHELAHLRRGDWVFLALSRVALALFWFNPLVWRLHADLASGIEDAADAAALRHIDPQAYARALVSLASTLTPRGATGMTGPARSLNRRIIRIMKTPRTAPSRPVAMALAVGALIAVATPLAAVELSARSAQEAMVPPIPPVPPMPPLPPVPPAPPMPPLPALLQSGDIMSGEATIVVNGEARPATPEERARMAAEVANATAEAQRVASSAHVQAAAAHAQAMEAAAAQMAAAAEAMSTQASAQVAEAMASARVQMRAGADQMDAGARQMRESANELRDPAFRAEQIRQNRERGNTITDAELQALIPQLLEQADEMEAQAEQMRSGNL